MSKLLLIALGGGIGSVARYLIDGWVQRATSSSFPTGTLLVNVSGCFAIGLLTALFAESTLREEYRVALLVGVLGGYTTFSSFGRDTFKLASDGQFLYAAANLLLTNVFGLAAVWLGHRVGAR
jgi:CrcB protein